MIIFAYFALQTFSANSPIKPGDFRLTAHLSGVQKQYIEQSRFGTFDDVMPIWSPDGMLICFERQFGRQRQGLYCLNRFNTKLPIVEIVGPEKKTVGLSPRFPPQSNNKFFAFAGDFCWSPSAPKGKKYPYIYTQGFNLYIGYIDKSMNVSPGRSIVELKKQGKNVVCSDADWAKQHDSIVFFSGLSGNGDIYLKFVNNGAVRKLTDGDGFNISPKWAPDGKKLVYVSYRRTKDTDRRNTDIYLIENVLDEEARRKTPLTNWDTDELNPSWSPDGEMIAFYRRSVIAKDEEIFDIWVMRADGKNPHRVAQKVYKQSSGPAWLPKEFGHQLIYISEHQNSIHVVDARSCVERTPETLQNLEQNVFSDVSCAPHQGAYQDKVWIAYSAVDKAARGRKRIYWTAFKMEKARK